MVVNGNFKFVLGAGEFQNFIAERLTDAQMATATHPAGRLIYNTTQNAYYYSDGTNWLELGNATAISNLQQEVDNIETASGGIFKQVDGTFDATVFSTFSNVTNPTDLLNALSQLDQAISGKDTLAELLDTNIVTPADKDVLQYDAASAKWVNRDLATAGIAAANHTHALNDLTDVVLTTPSNLQVLRFDGTNWVNATMNAGDLGDVALTAAAAGDMLEFDGTNWVNKPHVLNEVNDVTLTAPANNDVLQFNGTAWVNVPHLHAFNDLTDVVLTTPAANHFVVFDGTNWVNQDPITARTSLDVYSKAESDTNFVNVAGDSMTGNLVMSGNTVTSLANPVNASDAATKAYVDGLVSGLAWLDPVDEVNLIAELNAAPTTPVLGDAYLVGPTPTGWPTGIAAGDLVYYDGTTFVKVLSVSTEVAAGRPVRMLVSAESATAGAASDFVGGINLTGQDDKLVEIDGGTPGAWTYKGTVIAGNEATTLYTPADDDTVLVNETASYHYGHAYSYDAANTKWVEVAGPAALGAGTGLYYSGNVLHVALGAGIRELPTDEVGIDLFDATNGALILTNDGTTRSTTSPAGLHLLLDGSTLAQSATGLKVAASGITEVELNASVAGAGLVGGAGTPLAVNVDNLTLEVVTDTVQVKAGGITNTHLANSTITIAANAGTADPVALGETLTVTGGAAINTTVGANSVTIDFTGGLTDLSDVTVTGAAAGDMLVHNGTNFVNQKIHFVYVSTIAGTSHVVSHNLGQKYCQVTVVDVNDEVIIPQSIVFNDANTLTVTFNSAINCRVIVTGVAGV